MAKTRKVGLYDSILSLGNFAAQGIGWLLGPAVAVGGPVYLVWESVVQAAAEHGWWVYPFVVVLALAAIFGLWMFVLHLNSRIRLLGSADIRIDEEQQNVKRIADQALSLAAEINELIGEHQSRPPTIYDHKAEPEQWMRDNWNINQSLLQKFMTKHATKAHSVLLMAKRYGVLTERDINWAFTTMSSSHSVGEVRNLLVTTALELQDRLQIPAEHVLPHIPTYDEQKRLPFDDGR